MINVNALLTHYGQGDIDVLTGSARFTLDLGHCEFVVTYGTRFRLFDLYASDGAELLDATFNEIIERIDLSI